MRRLGFISLLALTGFIGCKQVATNSMPQSGHYEGTIIGVQNKTYFQIPVHADLTVSGSNAILHIANLDGSERPLIEFEINGDQSASLVIGELGNNPLLLTQDQDCLTSQTATIARLCASKNQIHIEVQKNAVSVFDLSLDYFAKEPKPLLEAPKVYSLDEAMKRAFTMSFETQIEFQNVMAARHTANNAYLNLLPHLSLNSILTAAQSMAFVDILAVASDIAPFLFPSRWMQADADKLNAEAERDALTLMRGDVGIQIEGFAYQMERDGNVLSDYDQSIKDDETLYEQVRTRESFGQFPPGTADTILTSLNAMKLDRQALGTTVTEQKTYIAQSLGLVNPNGVEDLTAGPDSTPIASAKPLDETEVENLALTRSFELRQMDFLIDAAQKMQQASYYSWLDPAGDPAAGLGFGLGDYVAIRADKVKELQIKREQVKAQLLQSAANAVVEYNDALQTFAFDAANLKIQNQRLEHLLVMLQFSNDVNMVDLATVYQDRLLAEINLLSVTAQYEITKAKIDRLLLESYYTQMSRPLNSN